MTGPDANTQDTRLAVTTQVRQQACTLASSDSFLLLATWCVVCLVVVSFMSKVPTQYRQVTAALVEAK
jgi:DHA2 family multidrug resistance protein